MSILTVPTTRRIYTVASKEPLLSVFQFSAFQKSISLEERVTLLLVRDLVRIGWRLKSNSTKSWHIQEMM